MNKKFKIVSSIALAGMLLTGSLGMNRVNAAEQTSVEDNYTTNPVGIYRKLVEGKTVVPFILANIDDVLTVRDIVNSEKFEGTVERVNGNTVSALDLPVGTGDTFTTTDGTEYTVVVYGDVDGNGRINPDDALEVDKYYLDLVSLNDAQKEAADVDDGNAGNINPDDSLRIRKYYVDLETSVIDNLPPAEEVVQESNYSMTVNKGGYINNVNEKNSSVEISLKETLDKKATLKLVISDQDEDTADIEKNIEIPAHMDYVTPLPPSGIDLSGLKDGTVTASLYDGDKLVAKYEIVMNTDNAPNTASVRTNRVSTREATLSLESMGASNVTKVRYVVLDKDAAEPQVKELTNSLDVQNNKLTDATIATDLNTDTVYRVWYIVENEYGSIEQLVVDESKEKSRTENQFRKYFVGYFLDDKAIVIYFNYDGDDDLVISDESCPTFNALDDDTKVATLMKILYKIYIGDKEYIRCNNINEVFTEIMVMNLENIFEFGNVDYTIERKAVSALVRRKPKNEN